MHFMTMIYERISLMIRAKRDRRHENDKTNHHGIDFLVRLDERRILTVHLDNKIAYRTRNASRPVTLIGFAFN